jgi:hypothetical protein
VVAQIDIRFGTAPDGGDRVQPGVEAADADANDPAQRRHSMIAPFGRQEGEFRHATPLGKNHRGLAQDQVLLLQCFTSRLSRSISTSSAFRAASASAEPAARISVRQVLSWPVLNPNSVATSDSPRPPPSSRLTACALNSAVNRHAHAYKTDVMGLRPRQGDEGAFASCRKQPRGIKRDADELLRQALNDRAELP